MGTGAGLGAVDVAAGAGAGVGASSGMFATTPPGSGSFGQELSTVAIAFFSACVIHTPHRTLTATRRGTYAHR